MEHTNFCRQMVQQYSETLENYQTTKEQKTVLSHAIDLAKCSQKFMMPDGGRLIDDPDFRGLNEKDTLRLPFPFIALEYIRKKEVVSVESNTANKSSKAIVFARERENGIVVSPMAWVDSHRIWGPMPEVAIPKVDYLDRTVRVGGYTGIRAYQSEKAKQIGTPEDYEDELGALLCFLNALACSNVHSEVSRPKVAKKLKQAHPFDSYYILTIDCPKGSGPEHGAQQASGRHPREHLRRGHIRRLQDGRRLWINATVVSAGVGGKISKDYAVRDPRKAAADASSPADDQQPFSNHRRNQ